MNERAIIEHVLERMEAHMLDDAIRSDKIAQECGISERHLYRLFKQMTGHTLKSYLRLRRLTLASKALVTSDASIIDIAFTHQFQSPEVFTRAFRRAFWLTPSQYRKTGCQHDITRQDRITTKLLDYTQRMHEYEPPVHHFEAKTFTGIQTIQRNFGLRTPQNWKKTQKVIQQLRDDHAINGHWQLFAKSGSQSLGTFDAVECFVGEPDVSVPTHHAVTHITIPQGDYAEFPYHDDGIPYEVTLQHAYRWLKHSAFGHADSPTLFHSTSPCGQLGSLFLPITRSSIQGSMRWWKTYDNILQQALSPDASATRKGACLRAQNA